MNSFELPNIISAGVYDASYHIKKNESNNRKTHLFEIELPIENGGTSFIDSASHAITRGTLICAKPGQTRHTRPPFRCYYIHFLLESGTAFDELMSSPDFVETNDSERYFSLFSDMCRYNDTGIKRDILKMQSLLLELIYLIGEESERSVRRGNSGTHKESDKTIMQAIEYIDNNFTEISGLEDIASHVHLSPVYFQSKFKSATGVTPHNYVLDKKIRKAADLILTTDLSLSRIAYECGFSSQAYFSYIFKKRMDMTPREYMLRVYNKYL